MMTTNDNPLIGAAPAQVPLPDAPLVRVVAQVRFPSNLAVQSPERVAPFQEAIRAVYPLLSQEHEARFMMGSGGIQSSEQQPLTWRFSDTEDKWHASLTSEFISLDTATGYDSREDFLERMGFLLDAVKQHLDPGVTQQIGMRYVARVVGEPLERITQLIRPELHGVQETSLSGHIQNSIGEAHLEAPDEEASIRLRWGTLSAGIKVDLNVIEPVDERSWLLDIDMTKVVQINFETNALTKELSQFSERLYSMFRWSITDQFLIAYGGKP